MKHLIIILVLLSGSCNHTETKRVEQPSFQVKVDGEQGTYQAVELEGLIIDKQYDGLKIYGTFSKANAQVNPADYFELGTVFKSHGDTVNALLALKQADLPAKLGKNVYLSLKGKPILLQDTSFKADLQPIKVKAIKLVKQ